MASILTVKKVYLKTIRTCKGRILTIFNIYMKDSLMQGPMSSKPALIVKVTLQQVNMANVQCQDVGTTTNVPSIQNQHHCGYPIYVLKRTTTTIGQKRTRVDINSSSKTWPMRRRIS